VIKTGDEDKRITFLTLSPWTSITSRIHHFARLFKKDGYAVNVVDLHPTFGYFIKEWINRSTYAEQLMIPSKRYAVYRPFPVTLNMKYALFDKLYKRYLIAKLSKLKGKAFTNNSILWVDFNEQFYPELVETIYHLPKKSLIVDVRDDFRFFANEKTKETVQISEKMLCENADLVITLSRVLYDRLKTYNPNTVLIFDGADERFILKKGRDKLPRPADIPPGRVIGYIGKIDMRLDFSLLSSLVKKLKELNFVFIGRIALTDTHGFKKLLSNLNFHYLGEKPRSLLPLYISSMNIGIIPFLVNPLTSSMDPIKLYDYLACGVPVISTPLPEIEKYSKEGIVEIARDSNSFIEKIEKLFELDHEKLREERRNLARENSWPKRYEQLIDVLKKVINV
jgi:glycosyltransferase involved in cell wall biosynthesis